MAASFPIEAMSLFGDLPPPKKAKEDDGSHNMLVFHYLWCLWLASERSLAITYATREDGSRFDMTCFREEKAPTTTELNDSATTVDIPSAWVSSAAHASRRGERDELQDTYILEVTWSPTCYADV